MSVMFLGCLGHSERKVNHLKELKASPFATSIFLGYSFAILFLFMRVIKKGLTAMILSVLTINIHITVI